MNWFTTRLATDGRPWRGADYHARSAILPPMSKHPKLTAEPTTASNRLTPQEIVELRESVHRWGAELRAILAARKKQAEAE